MAKCISAKSGAFESIGDGATSACVDSNRLVNCAHIRRLVEGLLYNIASLVVGLFYTQTKESAPAGQALPTTLCQEISKQVTQLLKFDSWHNKGKFSSILSFQISWHEEIHLQLGYWNLVKELMSKRIGRERPYLSTKRLP